MGSRLRLPRASHASGQVGALSPLAEAKPVPQPHGAPLMPNLAPGTTPANMEVDAPKPLPRPRATVLLVNAEPFALRGLETCLLAQGYGVIPASTFQMAKELLNRLSPDLLVADVRLGAFNGLHLAVRSHFHYPDRPVIISHTAYDPVLEVEARRLGATFIAKPLQSPEFLRQVRTALDKTVASTEPPVA